MIKFTDFFMSWVWACECAVDSVNAVLEVTGPDEFQAYWAEFMKGARTMADAFESNDAQKSFENDIKAVALLYVDLQLRAGVIPDENASSVVLPRYSQTKSTKH
jgi:hypothetical protein